MYFFIVPLLSCLLLEQHYARPRVVFNVGRLKVGVYLFSWGMRKLKTWSRCMLGRYFSRAVIIVNIFTYKFLINPSFDNRGDQTYLINPPAN
jgi:hypothetical protein